MGKMASKLRFVTRPIKNYNIESRAMKVISKDKPTPAPTYPSLQKMMQEIRDDPELLNKGKLSNEEIKNFSQVFVTSRGDNQTITSKNKLPYDRHTHDEYLYGYDDPVNVAIGKVSIRQLLELLERHAADPDKYPAEILAVDYKLDLQTTQNLLKYFRTFQVFLQPKGEPVGNLETVKTLIVKPFVFEDNKNRKKQER